MNILFRQAHWIALIYSVATLSAVFISEYGFDLKPCVLCIYQRWPYAVAITVFILWAIFHKKIGAVYAQALMAISFLTTAGIGAYHVGVEQGWWQGTSECGADTSVALSLDELKKQLMSAPLTKCNEVAWEMFGISMAGYNFIFATLMAIFILIAIVKRNELSKG